MTPARLHFLVEMDNHMHAEAERRGGEHRPPVSTNPAADLAELRSLGA
jgi:hypothetical protein